MERQRRREEHERETIADAVKKKDEPARCRRDPNSGAKRGACWTSTTELLSYETGRWNARCDGGW